MGNLSFQARSPPRSALDANRLFRSIQARSRPRELQNGIAMTDTPILTAQRAAEVLQRLGSRSVVFVGLMGAGKTAIGRKVAQALGLPFMDSDHEIEAVSRLTI